MTHNFKVTIYKASADGYMYSIKTTASMVDDVGQDRVFFPEIYQYLIKDEKTQQRWQPDETGHWEAKLSVHSIPSICRDLYRRWRFFDFLATYGQVKAVDTVADETQSLYGFAAGFGADESERAVRTNRLLYAALLLLKNYTQKASTMHTTADNAGGIDSATQPLPGWLTGQVCGLTSREAFFMMGWLVHNLNSEVKLFESRLWNKAKRDWPVTQADYVLSGYGECHAALPEVVRLGQCDYAWPMLQLRDKDYRDNDGDVDVAKLLEAGNEQGVHFSLVNGQVIPLWGRRSDGVLRYEPYD